MISLTPNPYNAVHSFNNWMDAQFTIPVISFTSFDVGMEIQVPSYAVIHHELSDDSISAGDRIGEDGSNRPILGRHVIGEARIVAYVGISGTSYRDAPESDNLLLMRKNLFDLFRFRPRIEIRNYETNTDFADLEVYDKGHIACNQISEESAISDVKDSYILLEQAFRVRYEYVHQVIDA